MLVEGGHGREGPGRDELSGAGARAPWWRGRHGAISQVSGLLRVPRKAGGALKSSRAVDDGAKSAPGTGGVCSRRLSPQFPRGSGRTRAPGNVLTLNCEQG